MAIVSKDRPRTDSSTHHNVFLSMPHERLYADSEDFSLAELCAVVWERKLIVILVTALAALAGSVVSLGEPRYSYVTSIEVGARLVEDRFTLLEPPETVMTKIRENYVPLVLWKAAEDGVLSGKGRDLNVRIPRNSQIIVLESSGPLDEKAAHTLLHNAVLQQVVSDHKRMIDLIKNALHRSLIAASNKLARLKDEEDLVRAQLGRIGQEAALVLKEIRATGELISSAMENRERAIREASNEVRAMTLLMLADEVRRNRTRFTDLERRAKVELPNERDRLNKLLAEKQRQQIDQENTIERIRLQMASVHETRAVAPTIQSISAVGTPGSVIVSLAILAGLFVSVTLALVVHSFSTRNRMTPGKRVGEDAELELKTQV